MMTGNPPNGAAIVPMICAGCGATMNPHAEKPVVLMDESGSDWLRGAVIEQVHQCPRCGAIESRRVES
jgi:hypothetical protein